jgi:hypothetical protein
MAVHRHHPQLVIDLRDATGGIRGHEQYFGLLV